MPLNYSQLRQVVLTRVKQFLLIIVVVFVGCTAFAMMSFIQRKQPTQELKTTKLVYTNPDLSSDNYTHPVLAPIPISSSRLLVPVGDTLYMLDSNNRFVWHYSFEPDIIRDVMVDPKGDIYITASEALILVLNSSGKEVWRKGMSTGSAWYTQIKSYGDGFLVIVDMEAYRKKGSNSEDVLEFWKDKKKEWSKPFPRGAKLQIAGNRILAIATTKEGREITEIR
ncbi:MAG: hypothetical protein ABR568_03775 [Pyrinomonadaceae bacterium]